MAIPYLPYLFSGGDAARARGSDQFQQALSRRQRERQFRRQMQENRDAQDKQIEAQKDAQDRAFMQNLGTLGISSLAGGVGGYLIGDAVTPVANEAIQTSKTIGDATSRTTLPTGVTPTFPDEIAGGPTLPPVDYSASSTNIPAANSNPGVTGIDNPISDARMALRSVQPSDPSLVTHNGVPGTTNAGPIPVSASRVNPMTDSRIPAFSRGAPLSTRGISRGKAAALGALSPFAGRDLVSPYVNYATRAPIANAQYGLDLAQTGSRIGLDAARMAEIYAGADANSATADDRRASAETRRALRDPQVASERARGMQRIASAGASDARADLYDAQTTTENDMRPLSLTTERERGNYYRTGAEGRERSNQEARRLEGPKRRKAIADASYAESRAMRGPSGGSNASGGGLSDNGRVSALLKIATTTTQDSIGVSAPAFGVDTANAAREQLRQILGLNADPTSTFNEIANRMADSIEMDGNRSQARAIADFALSEGGITEEEYRKLIAQAGL